MAPSPLRNAQRWYFHPAPHSSLLPFYAVADVDKLSRRIAGDLKLGSIIELNLRSNRDRDMFPLTISREYSDKIVSLSARETIEDLNLLYLNFFF